MTIDRSLSRRQFLRALAGGTVAFGALPLIAACGGDTEAPETGTSTAAGQSTESPTAATSGAATPTGTGSPAATPAGTPAARGSGSGSVTVYSGRNEGLVGDLVKRFSEETGIKAEVRYGDTAELAAAILEEGENSPADVFFAQDAGALGAVTKEGLFQALSNDVLELVEPRFRSDSGMWVGVSGRARVVVYNTEQLSEADIPASILDFTDPKWKGMLGWAPTNGSFQAFVTALRVIEGDDTARAWLEGLKNNDTKTYENNTSIVRAAMSGEIAAGFVNHYYLHRELSELGEDAKQNPPARNYIYRDGDPGALINVAGVGVLKTAKNAENAATFAKYLLSTEAQTYFAEQTFEYPLVEGVEGDPDLVPLAEIETPDIDLSNLDDLQGTVEMLREVGVL